MYSLYKLNIGICYMIHSDSHNKTTSLKPSQATCEASKSELKVLSAKCIQTPPKPSANKIKLSSHY